MKMKFMLIILLVLLVGIQAVYASTYDIVVVRGDIPVDLMVSQVYTHNANIPLITVTRNGFTKELETELIGYKAQGYKNALIVGGEEAVSNAVRDNLIELNYSVTRIWDWTRYGTSARVALTLWETSDTVVVAQGEHRGNLISAARIAIDYNGPLLLTEEGELSEEVKRAIQGLGASRIILIGNVSTEVKEELSALGGVEQTKFSQIQRVEEKSGGLFFVGLIIGALLLFLLSSLWGTGIFRRRYDIPQSVLHEDEKVIANIISEEERVTQNDLIKKTSFSRSKISRIVSNLNSKGIIIKEKSGKTYVLKLKTA